MERKATHGEALENAKVVVTGTGPVGPWVVVVGKGATCLVAVSEPWEFNAEE